jgi:ribosomal protein S18 acetylase RimI-like enzyme
VLPECAGKGLGGGLIAAVLAYHNRKFERVYLTTEDFRTSAIHLYQRYGFTDSTEEKALEGM